MFVRQIGIIIFLIFLMSSGNGWCQSYYWVGFTDKKNSPWSVSNPEAFLSLRSIDRRNRQQIAIDSLDLPVNQTYINQVIVPGVSLVHSSKWMNGITVKTNSATFAADVAKLGFVKEVQLTKRSGGMSMMAGKFRESWIKKGNINTDANLYGESYHQVAQINAQYLHEQGFRGQDMHIAVLDAGFYGVDKFAGFDSLWQEGRILGTHDFVEGDVNVFDGHFHGMSVLSAMAGNITGQLIGTAPKASYWLLRSEDEMSEFLIEEDNWIAAAEFADSAGVDVINSSLGYSTFDDPEMNHSYADMNGNTTRITRGANIAASRGIIVVASAGNEGRESNPWKYILAPSDGENVLAVGAVNKDGMPAPFTSYGPSSNGNVKPDVAAVGWNTILQRSNGETGSGNGTSYSAPIMAGAAASLWQANPHASAEEVKNAIRKSAHLYPGSDSLIGYGIPDLKLADRILKNELAHTEPISTKWHIFPNPASDYIVLQKKVKDAFPSVLVTFYSLDGKFVFQDEKPDASRIILSDIQRLPPGLSIMQIRSGNISEVVRINIIR